MNKKLLKNSLLIALTVILFTACNKNSEETTVTEDKEAPIEYKEMTQLPSEESSPSSTTPVAYVNQIFQEGDTYKAEIDKATMYGGRKAIEVAMEETKCPIEKVFNGDCAPSLNNNFYISNPEKKMETLEMDDKSKIEIYTTGEKREIGLEELYNLWTQTDAFRAGTDLFMVEISPTGKITKMSPLYLP
ncbi:MAG: hypothetical protein WC873_01175 [Candidatus Gracilibacteria bacterium]